jgi:hypothetical protein
MAGGKNSNHRPIDGLALAKQIIAHDRAAVSPKNATVFELRRGHVSIRQNQALHRKIANCVTNVQIGRYAIISGQRRGISVVDVRTRKTSLTSEFLMLRFVGGVTTSGNAKHDFKSRELKQRCPESIECLRATV